MKQEVERLDSLPEPARKLYETLSKGPLNPFGSFQREVIEKYELVEPYLKSSLLTKLELQGQTPFLEDGIKVVLFTDKDKTLVAKDEKGSVYSKGKGLIETLNNFNIPAFVVSGADYNDVNEDIKNSGLDIDGIACNVGTNSFVRDLDGEYIQDKSYEGRLIPFSENKLEIVNILESVFKEFKDYKLGFQNDKHKALEGNWEKFMDNLYFDIPLNTESAEVAIIIDSIYKRVKDSLAVVGIDIKFNVCEEFRNNKNPDREFNRYCLDVLAGNKDGALNQTVEAIEILQPEKKLFKVTAGDSGNDISLFDSPNCDMFVIVGGADKAAGSEKSYLEQGIEGLGFKLDKIGGTNVHRATNHETGESKFVYIEDETSERVGPQSIEEALKQLQIFHTLMGV